MTVLSGGVYHHTDPGKQGASAPSWYSIQAGFVPQSARNIAEPNQTVWSYTVPVDTKTTVQSLMIYGSPPAAMGSILNQTIRFQRRPLARVTWLVDAAAVCLVELWSLADAETPVNDMAEKPSLLEHSMWSFGDGVQFTAGQVFTATVAPYDHALTDGIVHGQAHRLRLWGKRTDTGAFMSIKAVAYPADLTTASLTWNDLTTTYTVPAGGFTLLGAAWGVEVLMDYTLMLNGNLRLNGVPIMDIGPLCAMASQNPQPLNVPLWDVELYPGDVLELQGSCMGACNQAITVLLTGEETPYAAATTYLMRAYNVNINLHIYWHHTAIDLDGTFSPYDPADLNDIVLISIIPG